MSDELAGRSEEFKAAVANSRKLAQLPSQEELLELYALFKQATVGDVNTARPGMMDFKGKYKWDAWKGKEGTSQEAADTEYVALVKKMHEKHGTQ